MGLKKTTPRDANNEPIAAGDVYECIMGCSTEVDGVPFLASPGVVLKGDRIPVQAARYFLPFGATTDEKHAAAQSQMQPPPDHTETRPGNAGHIPSGYLPAGAVFIDG